MTGREPTRAERLVLMWLCVASAVAACAALWRLWDAVAVSFWDAPDRVGGAQ